MPNKKRSLYQRIMDRIHGEHSSCPAYWWSAGMEDCDEGCHITYRLDCWKCKYRFYPKFIVAFIVKHYQKKEEEYFEKFCEEEFGEERAPEKQGSPAN